MRGRGCCGLCRLSRRHERGLRLGGRHGLGLHSRLSRDGRRLRLGGRSGERRRNRGSRRHECRSASGGLHSVATGLHHPRAVSRRQVRNDARILRIAFLRADFSENRNVDNLLWVCQLTIDTASARQCGQLLFANFNSLRVCASEIEIVSNNAPVEMAFADLHFSRETHTTSVVETLFDCRNENGVNCLRDRRKTVGQRRIVRINCKTSENVFVHLIIPHSIFG
nr:MAG TPA: hypothetical protein [Caudoviricetes sp.]